MRRSYAKRMGCSTRAQWRGFKPWRGALGPTVVKRTDRSHPYRTGPAARWVKKMKRPDHQSHSRWSWSSRGWRNRDEVDKCRGSPSPKDDTSWKALWRINAGCLGIGRKDYPITSVRSFLGEVMWIFVVFRVRVNVRHVRCGKVPKRGFPRFRAKRDKLDGLLSCKYQWNLEVRKIWKNDRGTSKCRQLMADIYPSRDN